MCNYTQKPTDNLRGTLRLCKLEEISSFRVSYLGFTVTFHPTFQSYIITKLLLPSAYRKYFIRWGPLPCFKVITAKEPGYEWEVTARRIALGMDPHDGLYQHKCVCVYWGRALTLLLFTHSPAKQSALPFPRCPRTAQLLCSFSSQWWTGWSDLHQKAAQILAMLLWGKQIKQKSKPRIPGRAEGTVGCGQESEAYGLLH